MHYVFIISKSRCFIQDLNIVDFILQKQKYEVNCSFLQAIYDTHNPYGMMPQMSQVLKTNTLKTLLWGIQQFETKVHI